MDERQRDKTDRKGGRECVLFGGAAEQRKGGHKECRSVAQLPPELQGNMTPNSKAGRWGNGSAALAQAGLICWLPAGISVTGES